MLETVEWYYYYSKYLIRLLKKRLHISETNVSWKKRDILDISKTNDWLYSKIVSGEPFLAGRLGATELRTILDVLKGEKIVCKSLKASTRWSICNWSGFFPDDEIQINHFADLMLNCIKYVDLFAAWNDKMEDYILKKYASSCVQCCVLAGLEPYYNMKSPWSRALKNKRVLVIHPFEQSILYQYTNNRAKIFPESQVLPEFELLTLKAIQTIAGQKDDRFGTWFEALQYMVDEVKTKEFDIAIIGCGAYGLPLAAEIKNMGKQAIHMGGATQVLFGIKGKRWIENPAFDCIINDTWISPMENEIPQNAEVVENGCYW